MKVVEDVISERKAKSKGKVITKKATKEIPNAFETKMQIGKAKLPNAYETKAASRSKAMRLRPQAFETR